MVFHQQHSAGVGDPRGARRRLLTGVFNGVVIVYGRVNAVIATLARTRGIAFSRTSSPTDARKATRYRFDIRLIARGAIAGIPTLIWILVVVALAVHLLLRYTDLRRNIYAMGGKPDAARLAGINLNRYVIGCYIAAGVFAALAGIMLTARTGSGQPTSGSQGLELQSITAAALRRRLAARRQGAVAGTILPSCCSV